MILQNYDKKVSATKTLQTIATKSVLNLLKWRCDTGNYQEVHLPLSLYQVNI